ncbi:MAG: EAL domain-containing protein [Xanthomonadales bacterium]|nr:EAL domain-containing protein [Xanthomonadales bacterium]MCB1634493.1 EAL domain-containing protein [Xanthomonadales bacterium]
MAGENPGTTVPSTVADGTVSAGANVFRRTPAVAFCWDPAPGWVILEASANVIDWGYEPQDLVTSRVRYADLIHPDDLQRVIDEARGQSRQGWTSHRHQYRLRRADGRWMWVDDHTWSEAAPDGGPSVLHGVVVDIGEHKEASLALELAASAVPQLLQGRQHPEAAIAKVLAQLGEGTAADRVYLFENREDSTHGEIYSSQRYEWVRDGIEAQIDNPDLQNLPLRQYYSRWVGLLSADQVICGRIDEFPPDERALLESQGILSLLVVPIILDNRFWGFLGFDSVSRERNWRSSEERVLRIAAYALGAFIEEMRAVDRLQLGEERLRMTLEAVQAGAWVWDRAAGTALWSHEHYQMFEIDAEGDTVDNETWRQRIHPADLPAVERSIEIAVEKGRPMDIEYRVQLPQKGERWMHSRGNVIRDERGDVTGMVGIVLDVSERHTSEDRLRLSAAVIDATRDGVLVTDLTPAIRSVNRAFCEITGYAESEVLGQDPRLLDSGRHDGAMVERLLQRLQEQGYWQGELWIRDKLGAAHPEWTTINAVRDEQGRVQHYVAVLTDVSRLKQTEERLQRLAHFDPLTDLPNRLLAQSRLDQCLRRADPERDRIAVLFIDLDGFKTVNDSLGHDLGDQLLVGIAKRFDAQLGENHMLARLGGDEFLLVIESIDSPAEAALAAQNLLQVFDEPYFLPGGHEVYASASVGIALYPSDGRQSGDIIRNADTAMYQAKASGRSTYQFYTAELTRTANERLALHGQLRRALLNDEFQLYYQPLMRVSDGAVIGVEALVRWFPPGGGMVLPARFIGVTEETGLILPLGDWVLRNACRQMVQWQAEGLSGLRLAVNLSARQLQQPGVVWQLQDVLEETGLAAASLELELTESSLMEGGEQAVDTLVALRALGVTLAIDDFGTGYSSLAYLKRFPVHTLKIDRSFVEDLSARSSEGEIAAAIIALSRSLRLDVLAEGVERSEQLDFLQRHGCDYYQGYMASRPLPAEQMAQWLREHRPVFHDSSE